MRLDTILHPTDFSESARRALSEAVRLAVAHNAALHVFHALLLHTEDPAVEYPKVDAWVEDARRLAAEYAGAGAAPLAISASTARGVSAFESVMEEIDRRRPDLLVIGTHGRSGLARLLMGSDAEKLLRHAPCPVLTVRADARASSGEPVRRILIPVDFSEASRHALDAGRALAAENGAAVTLLYVLEALPALYYAAEISSRFQLDSELEGRVRESLQQWAGADVDRLAVSEGTTATEILRVADAEGADMIVMGARGRTGLDHILVGSVTEKVCRFARLPVLVVR
jgi:nucleotide-binding universal stress UspA family protein